MFALDNDQLIQPMGLGVIIGSGISSITGSPILTIRQSLISNRVVSPSVLLLGIQIILLLAKKCLNRKTVSVLDTNNNQVVHISIEELQNLIQSFALKNSNNMVNQQQSNFQTDSGAVAYSPFPESPMTISVYIACNFITDPFSPSIWIFIPILTFPGLRGALPIIILSLLLTIFIRCMVPPETTGAKPLPEEPAPANSAINLNPDELLGILRRYGKYFMKH